MKVRKYLIVNARGDARVVGRNPTFRNPGLSFDEVAFPLGITVPDTWGRLYADLPVEIELPEPSELPSVEVGPSFQEDAAVVHPEEES